jgi:hypothetical protein
VKTKGLTDEDAARLHYIIACAASAFTDDYDTASNVPVNVLRATWHVARRQERLDLVT